MRARHLLLALALALLPLGAAPPDKVTLTWGMKPHDYLHYRDLHQVDDNGKPAMRDWLEHPVDLLGCDFDKEGKVALHVENLYDVPLTLAFQAPDRPVAPGDKWKVAGEYDALWTFPRIVAKGASEYVGPDVLDKTPCHVWKGSATIEEAKGKTANVNKEWIDAKVDWRVWFEADPGVVRRAELRWSMKYIGKPKASGEKPTEIVVVEELTRGELWRDRYENFQKKVDEAIDKGVAWVKGQQKADGSWGAYYEYTLGPSALALLTLLKGGVHHDDPAVQKGLAYVVAQPFMRTYEVALAMMAVDAFYTPAGEQDAIRRGQIKDFKRSLPPEHMAWMKKAADWLVGHAFGTGDWGYSNGTTTDRPDLSNTQYGVLGLHAAGRCGLWGDEDTWLKILKVLMNQQQKQGPPVRYTPKLTEGSTTEISAQARGWGYTEGGEPTTSMTCAGIAGIVLARDALTRMKAKKWNPRESAKALSAVKDGVGWLSEHYTVRANDPVNRDWYFYAMYGLERAGTLGDFERLAGHDWYYEGACVLIANQLGDGHWQDSGWVWLHDDCFAILFLKRATTALPTK